MAKRKTEAPPTNLDQRLDRLEKIVTKYFGARSIAELEESEEDNPVVEEKRFDKAVIKIHRDGKLEHLRICEWCGAEVTDIASHKAVCKNRPIF